MLDDETIESTLAGASLSHERVDDTTWRAVFVAGGRSFRLFLRRSGGWLRLEVSPLCAVPDDPARAAVLLRELLRRNRTLAEARFALADDGEVVIESVLDETASGAALSGALDALSVAAQAHLPALLKIL